MPDPQTSNLQLFIPLHGADVDTWDVPVNNNSAILDKAFGGVAAVALTNVPVSLSISQAQNAILRFSGILTGNVVVTLPAIVKFWTVQNNCTGAFVVTLTTGLGKVIGLPPGEPTDVFSDGTDVYFKNLGRTGSKINWQCAALPAWVTACTVLPYLIMDGTTFNATTYAALNAFLGGNTLPDFRGRVDAALDNQGGSAAGRLTNTTMNPDGNTVGATGGNQNLQAHTHTYSGTTTGQSVDHTHGISTRSIGNPGFAPAGGLLEEGSFQTGGTSADHTHNYSGTSASTGTGNSQNVQPTMIGGIYVIKT